MKAISFLIFFVFGQMLISSLAWPQGAFGDHGKLKYRLSAIHETQFQQLNSTPLNVDNELVPQPRYNSLSSADLFLNWRAFTLDIKTDAIFSDLEDANYEYTLRELYFGHPLGDHVQITVGRKILKWGTGFAFNPTGVVEPAKDAGDPSDRLNRFQGRPIIALDAYWGNHSLTLVYANELKSKGRFRLGDDELAVKFYSFIKDVDVSLIGHWKEKEKIKFGFNTAFTYGDHLELHSEFIAQVGSNKLYHQVLDSSDDQIFFGDFPYTTKYQSSKRLFYKLLMGMQYTFDSGLNLMAEYFYNRDGLTRTNWNQWRRFTLFHQKQIRQLPPNGASFPEFYNALNTLSPDGTMRHYGFIRGYLPKQKFGLELILFGNLVDSSGILIPTFNYYFNSHLNGWIRASYFGGREDSEFGMLFTKSSLELGLRLSF